MGVAYARHTAVYRRHAGSGEVSVHARARPPFLCRVPPRERTRPHSSIRVNARSLWLFFQLVSALALLCGIGPTPL